MRDCLFSIGLQDQGYTSGHASTSVIFFPFVGHYWASDFPFWPSTYGLLNLLYLWKVCQSQVIFTVSCSTRSLCLHVSMGGSEPTFLLFYHLPLSHNVMILLTLLRPIKESWDHKFIKALWIVLWFCNSVLWGVHTKKPPLTITLTMND